LKESPVHRARLVQLALRDLQALQVTKVHPVSKVNEELLAPLGHRVILDLLVKKVLQVSRV